MMEEAVYVRILVFDNTIIIADGEGATTDIRAANPIQYHMTALHDPPCKALFTIWMLHCTILGKVNVLVMDD